MYSSIKMFFEDLTQTSKVNEVLEYRTNFIYNNKNKEIGTICSRNTIYDKLYQRHKRSDFI